MEQRVSRARRVSGPPNVKWLTTFNDLITLLMVFFVLMFAMSKGDTAQIRVLRSAILQGLGASDKRYKGSDGLLETPRPQLDSGNRKHEAPVPPAVLKALKEIDAVPEVNTKNTEDGMIIRVSGRLFFASGSADINPDGYPLLGKIGKLIRRLPNRIRVEGHTDNVPISTDAFPSNWELSAVRAVNIVRFFQEQMGVHPRRLSAVGYGESQPVKASHEPEDRALNRRVEIVLIKDEKL